MKKVYSIQALNERASQKHQLNEKSALQDDGFMIF